MQLSKQKWQGPVERKEGLFHFTAENKMDDMLKISENGGGREGTAGNFKYFF